MRRKRRKEREGVPAPPAMVPSRYGLISITFLTVPEAVRFACFTVSTTRLDPLSMQSIRPRKPV